MPTAIRCQLDGPVPETPYQHAAGLHRLVLDWMDVAYAGLGADLHDRNQPHPLTVGPVWSRDRELWFEVALLDDALLDALLVGAAARTGPLRLGVQSYRIGAPELIGAASWDEMLSGPPDDDFALRLLSPVAHHTAGESRKSVVLPSPELYFGSWLRRWNLFSHRPIDADILRSVETHVAVVECEGRTLDIRLPRGRGGASTPFTGFVGNVRFTLLQPSTVPESTRLELTALARLSCFSGTGVDTMRRMGQTEYRGGAEGRG